MVRDTLKPSIFNTFELRPCFVPQRRALVEHLNFQKLLRTWCAFSILTSKCASRRSAVHFLNISTSKRLSKLRCFVHFDFQMCFTPQRRVLFPHHNFQKCSGREVFLAFWLRDVLRPQRRALSISHLPRWFRTRRFSFFSDSSHLCFSIHIVGSLTSKLPSIMHYLVSC